MDECVSDEAKVPDKSTTTTKSKLRVNILKGYREREIVNKIEKKKRKERRKKIDDVICLFITICYSFLITFI